METRIEELLEEKHFTEEEIYENIKDIHLPKELLIGTFVTMPSSIRQMLSDEGYVEVKINNLTELSISAN